MKVALRTPALWVFFKGTLFRLNKRSPVGWFANDNSNDK